MASLSKKYESKLTNGYSESGYLPAVGRFVSVNVMTLTLSFCFVQFCPANNSL